MSDLTDLTDLAGEPLTPDQIHGILAQIDLDITNLLRDGKLAAVKYTLPGPTGRSTDRAANLRALLDARRTYQKLLDSAGGWTATRADVFPQESPPATNPRGTDR